MAQNITTELNDIARTIRGDTTARLQEIAKEDDLQGQTFDAMRAKLTELITTLEKTAHNIEDGAELIEEFDHITQDFPKTVRINEREFKFLDTMPRPNLVPPGEDPLEYTGESFRANTNNGTIEDIISAKTVTVSKEKLAFIDGDLARSHREYKTFVSSYDRRASGISEDLKHTEEKLRALEPTHKNAPGWHDNINYDRYIKGERTLENDPSRANPI